jgi:catechol 2,3-dioxygenase-like lactoylglutathione lyase family enzyme
MHLHHVQVSMPAGQEDEARGFYVGALGLTEVAKPASLQGRGGCWFHAVDDAGASTAEVHLGVDDPFIPAKKAHPAFVLGSVAELEERAQRITDAGFEVSWAERLTLEGFTRFHCRDGFGNRIEVLTQTP